MMLAGFYQTSGANGLWVFLLVTLVMGGGAAWATGRALAETWRPLPLLAAYAFFLALAVRFLQYALFAQPLLAPANIAVDYLILSVIAAAGFLFARRAQMARQYPWIQYPWLAERGAKVDDQDARRR